MIVFLFLEIFIKNGFYLGASETLSMSKFCKIKSKSGCSFINGKTIDMDGSNILIDDGRLVVNCQKLNLSGNIVSDSIKIESYESVLNSSSILSNNIYFRSNTLNIQNTKVESSVIDLASNKIISDNNTFIAQDQIMIQDVNNDIVEGIISPKIVYNSQDISNNECIRRKKTILF